MRASFRFLHCNSFYYFRRVGWERLQEIGNYDDRNRLQTTLKMV